MSIRTSPWPAGTPCWVDLGVDDIPAATAFYGTVLGWTFERMGPASVALRDGHAAAAIVPRHDRSPSGWNLSLASDDVDATAAAIRDAGGTVALDPGDVPGAGRLCIAADPSGAPFSVWQAAGRIGCEIVNAPGGVTWEDLRSTDPDAARAMYLAVFGYGADPLPAASPDYTLFSLPGDPAPLGGMGGLFRDEPPSHWLV